MKLKEYNTKVKKSKVELHKSSFTGREWRVLQRIFGTTPNCVAIKLEGNLNITKIDTEDFPDNYKTILELDPAEKTFDLENIKQFIRSKGGAISIEELYYTPMYRPTVATIKTLNHIIDVIATDKDEPHETRLVLDKESDILNIGYFIFSCVSREITWKFIIHITQNNSDMEFDINPFKMEYKLCLVNDTVLSVKFDNK